MVDKVIVDIKPLLKLDFGCGPRPREGFDGVDRMDFGQKHKVNLARPLTEQELEWRIDKTDTGPTFASWPWENESVAEAHTSHFVEHLTAPQRIHFANELYRVLAPAGKCQLIVPHWASCRAYGDLTHQWPPVSEFWFYYLNKSWREANAPHNDGYSCDFDATWSYSLNPALGVKNQDYQQYAIANFKEACQDIVATLVKK